MLIVADCNPTILHLRYFLHRLYSADPMSNMNIGFDTAEAAIAFAEKNGTLVPVDRFSLGTRSQEDAYSCEHFLLIFRLLACSR